MFTLYVTRSGGRRADTGRTTKGYGGRGTERSFYFVLVPPFIHPKQNEYNIFITACSCSALNWPSRTPINRIFDFGKNKLTVICVIDTHTFFTNIFFFNVGTPSGVHLFKPPSFQSSKYVLAMRHRSLQSEMDGIRLLWILINCLYRFER